MSFHASKWVLIGDHETAQNITDEQQKICEAGGDSLRSIIWCDENKEEYAKVCTSIPVFPALCNIETSRCIGGLTQLDELKD